MANFNININADVTDSNNILGETVAIGDLVYLSTDSKWYKSTALLLSKSTTELRITLEAGVLNDSISMLVYGYHTFTSIVLAVGIKYYVSTISGGITTNLYTGTNNTIRYIGTAYDSNTLLFNPDQTYIHDNGRKINNVSINTSHTHVETDITDLDKYTKVEVDALIAANQADFYFLFTQGVAATVWTINHIGNKHPSVYILDTLGNQVEGEIVYVSNTQLIVTFLSAFAGTAELN